MRLKKIASILLLVTMTSLVGCGGKGAEETAGGSTDKSGTEESVELTWYYSVNNTSPDQDEIFKKANEIIKKEINAEVKFMPIDASTYEQKMQTKYAAQDAGDINWTSSWRNNYNLNVAKGSFLDITDMLDKYAPSIKASFTDEQWEAVKIDGRIYGIPNYQALIKCEPAIVRNDLLEKYNFDLSTVKKPSDLEPFFDTVQAGEQPGTIFAMNSRGVFNSLLVHYGFDSINNLLAVKYDDKDLNVVNVFETPEFEDYLEMAKRWQEKGYIANDALTIKDDQQADMQAGKLIGELRGTFLPGVEVTASKKWSRDMKVVPISEAIINTAGVQSTINSITIDCKNPERALMFLELVNTNSELFNLLAFGIEGKHYEKNEDNTIRKIENSSYVASDWVFGNVTNGYLLEGQPLDTWEKTREVNKTAKPSEALGFSFDANEVKTEMAQIQTVLDEYLPGLTTGLIDYKEKLPEFRDKLKAAGASKVVELAQKQISEWKSNK